MLRLNAGTLTVVVEAAVSRTVSGPVGSLVDTFQNWTAVGREPGTLTVASLTVVSSGENQVCCALRIHMAPRSPLRRWCTVSGRMDESADSVAGSAPAMTSVLAS